MQLKHAVFMYLGIIQIHTNMEQQWQKEAIWKRVRRSRKGKGRWCDYIKISKSERNLKSGDHVNNGKVRRLMIFPACADCMYICVCTWLCMHMWGHIYHIPSVGFHFIFWERVSLLNPELIDSAKLPGRWASRIYMSLLLPVLRL